MAGVQAHAHFVSQPDPLDDRRQLLEPSADLAALARHGLEQKRRRLLGAKRLVEGGGDQVDADVDALPHVAARMHVVELAGRVLHAREVLRQRHAREIARLLGRRCRVERVGRMREDALDALLGRVRAKRRHVRRVDRLGFSAARVAREELERVGVDGHGVLRHVEIALRA